MSNSSPNAAQWLLLIISGLVGLWQFRIGLSAWKKSGQPGPTFLFMFSWLERQNKTSDNHDHQPSIVQRAEGMGHMTAGLFLILLPVIALIIELLT